jgi:hypothetical protein
MPTITPNPTQNSSNSTPTTNQNQTVHKRWYPQIPSDAHVDFHNASRFTWDALYQMRGWVRQLALTSGVALEGDSIGSGATGKSGTISSGSATNGNLSLKSNATGPSNSQISGLNVKAVQPSDGQTLAYNASSGQIEFTSPLSNVVQWTTTIPTSHSSPGNTGTIAFNPAESGTIHLYICIGPNLWGRVGIDATF